MGSDPNKVQTLWKKQTEFSQLIKGFWPQVKIGKGNKCNCAFERHLSRITSGSRYAIIFIFYANATHDRGIIHSVIHSRIPYCRWAFGWPITDPWQGWPITGLSLYLPYLPYGCFLFVNFPPSPFRNKVHWVDYHTQVNGPVGVQQWVVVKPVEVGKSSTWENVLMKLER